jgi:flagellin-like hook-associated protein FlgL
VDLDGAQSIQDVIDKINAADAGGGVTASFTTMGNGIVLSDSTTGSGTLPVTRANFSLALDDLGLNVAASGSTITGKDVNAVSASGIFGNLAKLRDALRSQDQSGMTQAAQSLNDDLNRVQRIHGQVGAQVKDIESRQQRLEDENTATQTLLSTLQDTDFNEAVTRFQTLQTALEANLQTTGKILNQSLLDFLT